MPIPSYQGGPNFANLETLVGGDGQKLIKVYNDTGGALTNGAIKTLAFEVDATDTSNPIIRGILKAPATQTTESNIICVVDNAILGLGTIASTDYGFVCVEGYTQALCDGTTDIAVGDQLEVLNTGTAFTQGAAATSGDSGALVPEAAAIAMQAYTTAADAVKKVLLIGRPCQVKAS